MTTEVIKQTELQRYYQLHSRIYDATRWSFLFGRKKIIDHVGGLMQPVNILEVGCGTGINLLYLKQRFPHASLTGIDLSTDMLNIATRKTSKCKPVPELVNMKYENPLTDLNSNTVKFDLILFSYALSMFNPGWDVALQTARKQLSDNGLIAVVDFSHSPLSFFRRWMKLNHVKMDQHLLPGLESQFAPIMSENHQAYLGLWQYLFFIGSHK
ncbi:MAG: class I SAM-dependent methyltransferase [Gammaproteobacteria bacterium]